MRKLRTVANRTFEGLNVRTPAEKLLPELFQVDLNGERRRGKSWQRRRGYSRFLSGEVVPTFVSEYTDDFNRADASDLGADWAGGYYGCVAATQVRVVSNEVRAGLGLGALMGASYTAASFSDDQASQVKVVNIGNASDSTPGCGVRFSSTGGYFMMVNGNNNTVRLYSITDWGDCTLGSSSVLTLDEYTTIGVGGGPIVSAGDTFRVMVNGTTIRGYLNSTLLLQATDVSYGSGDPGLIYSGGALTGSPWRMDNWGGGTSTTGVENVQVTGKPTRLISFERDDDTVKMACVYGDGVNPDNVDEFNTGTPEGLE